MSRPRTVPIVASALCGAFVATAVTQVVAQERSAADPLAKLEVTHKGLSVQGRLGSYCREPADGEPGSCLDVIAQRPPRSRLPVSPGGVLRIKTGASARKVTVSVERLGRGGPVVLRRARRATAIEGSSTRWRFRLPRKLRGGLGRANALGMSVDFQSGDQSAFDVGIRTDRCPATRR